MTGDNPSSKTELTLSKISKDRLPDYLSLFAASFPNFKVTLEYLQWLYYENPSGAVVGFDAMDNGNVVAHYACIPVQIDGYEGRSLLSLNTATHPDYQGRGLFRTLASKTYESAESDYACVVGVANANSFGGFIRHLGFEHLGNLELRWGNISRELGGSRCYDLKELQWRSRSPLAPLHLKELKGGKFQFTAKPFCPIFHIRSIVHTCLPQSKINPSTKIKRWSPRELGLTVDWVRGRKPLIFLPKRLKPSPLALIFKPLKVKDSSILSSWSFPDFDAL